MAEKVAITIQYVSMFFAGLGVALYHSWNVALVTLTVSPVFVLATVFLFKVSSCQLLFRKCMFVFSQKTFTVECIHAIHLHNFACPLRMIALVEALLLFTPHDLKLYLVAQLL